MGFYYRQPVSIGPFPTNLDKSGMEHWLGGMDFQTETRSRSDHYSEAAGILKGWLRNSHARKVVLN